MSLIWLWGILCLVEPWGHRGAVLQTWEDRAPHQRAAAHVWG